MPQLQISMAIYTRINAHFWLCVRCVCALSAILYIKAICSQLKILAAEQCGRLFFV